MSYDRKARFVPWDGDYSKHFYDVLLPTSEVVLCYPNAGKMHALLDGSGREFRPRQVKGVRRHQGNPFEVVSEEKEVGE
jgi:hypothetical protein